MRNAFLNEKGTSLIEILLSLLLTAVIFTGLLKSSLLAVNANVQNLLRDEAVSIAEQRINEARNQPFDALVSEPTATVYRDYRGMTTKFQFSRQMTVVPLGNPMNNKQVQVKVTWWLKGVQYNHSITTVVRRL